MNDGVVVAGEGVTMHESEEMVYVGNGSWKVKVRRVNVDSTWLKVFVSKLLEASETNMRIAYKADIENRLVEAITQEREHLLGSLRELSPAHADTLATVLAAEDTVARIGGEACKREHCGIAGEHSVSSHEVKP